jgi:hypothetical protein
MKDLKDLIGMECMLKFGDDNFDDKFIITGTEMLISDTFPNQIIIYVFLKPLFDGLDKETILEFEQNGVFIDDIYFNNEV